MPPKKPEAKAIEKLNQKLNLALEGSKAPAAKQEQSMNQQKITSVRAKLRVQDDFNVVPLKRNEKLELEVEDNANQLLDA